MGQGSLSVPRGLIGQGSLPVDVGCGSRILVRSRGLMLQGSLAIVVGCWVEDRWP